jgi:hypothetical protein
MLFFVLCGALAQSAQVANGTSEGELLNRQVSIFLPGQDGSIEAAFGAALLRARVPGGVASVSGCAGEITYEFPGRETSLRDALDKIVSTSRSARWQIDSGVVNLVPVKDMPALLDLPVVKFSLERVKTPREALLYLFDLPEVRERIAQLHLQELTANLGLSDLQRPGSPPAIVSEFRVHCENTTLRGALNAIARAHGFAVWSYTERHCGGRNEFRMEFLVQ